MALRIDDIDASVKTAGRSDAHFLVAFMGMNGPEVRDMASALRLEVDSRRRKVDEAWIAGDIGVQRLTCPG